MRALLPFEVCDSGRAVVGLDLSIFPVPLREIGEITALEDHGRRRPATVATPPLTVNNASRTGSASMRLGSCQRISLE